MSSPASLPARPDATTTSIPASPMRLLTADERQASMRRALDDGWNGHDDLWIFGYGSLIWRPEFDYRERRLAVVQDYHRALCMWSRVNRGTPEAPGLVFGLDHGGSCQGMAFRLPAANVETCFPALWDREMPTGAYVPRWLPCDTPDGPVTGLVFTMDRANNSYAGALPLPELLRYIRQGTGRYGPCTDYVTETADALRLHGIADPALEAIVLELRSARV